MIAEPPLPGAPQFTVKESLVTLVALTHGTWPGALAVPFAQNVNDPDDVPMAYMLTDHDAVTFWPRTGRG